jgi:formylglycine-generating enzyme required for sulfatase activity
MVIIPAGEFLMGTADADRETILREYTRHGASQEGAETLIGWELPQHRVKLPEFCLGKRAITQAQWSQVAQWPKVNLDLNPDPANFKGAQRPVEMVSWEEAVEFCDRLSRHTWKSYRLPSEAEWEYACRAGTTTPFHFGDTITADLVNCVANQPYGDAPAGQYRGQTTDVGSFLPNAFGLYGLHGNVWEWCADRWHANYQGAPTDGSAWLEGGSENYLLRGGSWCDYPCVCRAAYRLNGARDLRYYSFGFRVLCSA